MPIISKEKIKRILIRKVNMLSTVWQIGPVAISIGTIVAAICSWSRNKSVAWAAVHAFLLGWFYVVYWALTGGTRK